MYLPRTTYLSIDSFVHLSANLFSFLPPNYPSIHVQIYPPNHPPIRPHLFSTLLAHATNRVIERAPSEKTSTQKATKVQPRTDAVRKDTRSRSIAKSKLPIFQQNSFFQQKRIQPDAAKNFDTASTLRSYVLDCSWQPPSKSAFAEAHDFIRKLCEEFLHGHHSYRATPTHPFLNFFALLTQFCFQHENAILLFFCQPTKIKLQKQQCENGLLSSLCCATHCVTCWLQAAWSRQRAAREHCAFGQGSVACGTEKPPHPISTCHKKQTPNPPNDFFALPPMFGPCGAKFSSRHSIPWPGWRDYFSAAIPEWVSATAQALRNSSPEKWWSYRSRRPWHQTRS